MRLSLNCITGNNDHLYKRIQQSIATSTSINIIVSFLMESGVKLLAEDLKEAKDRGFNKIYLKTDLINYYEKFGAKYIEDLANGEKLYYIQL